MQRRLWFQVVFNPANVAIVEGKGRVGRTRKKSLLSSHRFFARGHWKVFPTKYKLLNYFSVEYLSFAVFSLKKVYVKQIHFLSAQ